MDKAKKVLWIIGKTFRYCYPYIIVNILVLSFSTMISLAINIINKDIVNELASSVEYGYISGIFLGLVIVYMLLYLIKMASGFLSTFGYNFYRLNVDLLFHKIFMWKSYKISQARFLERDFMEKYSFVGTKTGKISAYIGSLSNLVFSKIGTIIGAITLFAIYEPLLIAYSVIVIIISAITTGIISKKEFALDKKQIREQRFHDYYKKILTGKMYAKELRLYKLKDHIYDKWSRSYDKLRMEKLDLALKRIELENISVIIKFILRVIAIGILLFGIYNKRYDIGTFVLLFGLIETCNGQIKNFVSSIMSGVYKDVKYLVDYVDFVGPITNDEIKAICRQEVVDNRLKFGEFLELELKNVSFKYPNNNKDAIDNVSFKIKKGEIVSILGYNGSGKTTLSKIINGSFIPQSGMTLLNGKIVTESNREEVMKYFGIAPQEFSKFSLPIRDIVGLGRIEKINNEEELHIAYEKTDINALISRYSMGDKTVLGKEYDENGIDLSGGEWQQLIIASAYMGKPEILLMDEPTASIDPLKEMEMIKKFDENLKGKTAILISHRIGFARLADRIIMMQNGKISEEGTHEELLSKNGYYAKLFCEQKKLYDEEVKCS